MNKRLANQLKIIPRKTGIYIFKDSSGNILYIGKAKNIKKRVKSYFDRINSLSIDKKMMVGRISNIDYISVGSEYEAFLLESNLIKKYKPRYNVILKDDKNYLFIKIDYQDDFPKIYTTRKIERGRASYFGPFTDGQAVKQTLNLIRKMFPYRDCNQNIYDDNNIELKKKACLKYHIKKCLAPCIGAVSKDEYNRIIRKCELFLLGKRSTLVEKLKNEMLKASDKKNYEEAASLRNQIEAIKKITAKQVIISAKKENQDYISFVANKNKAFINLFIVREGKLIGKENFTMNIMKGNDDVEIITNFIKQYYPTATDMPKEIISQEKIPSEKKLSLFLSRKFNKKIIISRAYRGKRKSVIEMGKQNAQNYMEKMLGALGQKDIYKTLKKIKNIFSLENIPRRIECFDISNIQGKLATGSMVVFLNGVSDKKEYRRFKIKTVASANDVEMMREVILRRLKNKQWKYPDLIVLDGGRPQFNIIEKELKNIKIRIPMIALAKKEEEIYFDKYKKPFKLSKNSEELKLLQRIRDDAHRFAIRYHKILRKKKVLNQK